MQKETVLSNKLQEAGAEIFYYQELGIIPEARFSVINDGRIDARCAIGVKNELREQEVRVFYKGHPIFALTNDILSVLKRTAKKANI